MNLGVNLSLQQQKLIYSHLQIDFLKILAEPLSPATLFYF